MKFKTIEWKGDRVRLLDQRKLPVSCSYLECRDVSSICRAITGMAIRGAPAIGIAAAMGIALARKRLKKCESRAFSERMEKVCRQLSQTRPTAVNLFWAVERMRRVLDEIHSLGTEGVRRKLEEEALRIYREDLAANQKIGQYGKRLIRNGDGVLTHCNAGGLATAGYGTALGVIYAAWETGKQFQVFADETRPLLQGARLTSWELVREKIPVTVIADNMAGWLMKKGEINLVIVGADRIAANGDTANKIGTYSLAALAKCHGVPFYVAAPTSTLDLSIKSGKDIPIEERSGREITHLRGRPIVPSGVKTFNPAFDVTPHSLIHGFITEKGIIRKPFERALRTIKP